MHTLAHAQFSGGSMSQLRAKAEGAECICVWGAGFLETSLDRRGWVSTCLGIGSRSCYSHSGGVVIIVCEPRLWVRKISVKRDFGVGFIRQLLIISTRNVVWSGFFFLCETRALFTFWESARESALSCRASAAKLTLAPLFFTRRKEGFSRPSFDGTFPK